MKTAVLALCVAAASPVSLAADGLRVATWNITNYGGGNAGHIANVAYGEFEGRRLDADLFLLQEFMSQSALDSFVSALNSAAGSPGDWVGATFYGGASGGLNTALAYRASKLDLLGSTIVSLGSTSANPRNIIRYDLRLDGYGAEETVISVYPVHMKAGSGSTDQSRRLIEADKIRTDAENLPAGRHIIVGGDFNIQSSFQAAYVELTGSQANNNGRVFDPIAAPGTWNNSFTFRYIHTQDPVGGGGMDDRLDQILLSAGLGDGVGLDYVGQFLTPWDLNRYDDPNHSYRCWGNDGSSYNQALRTSGNEMVGASIAQSIIVMAGNTGHCPVYLDMVVPAKADVTASIDFGSVVVGQAATAVVEVANSADVGVWGAAGIRDLEYAFVATGALTAPAGAFFDGAGGAANTHVISADTSSVGPIEGTLVVLTDDPDAPTVEVAISGNVIAPPCPADLVAPFGVLDLSDVSAFVGAFVAGEPLADVAPPFGLLDLSDVSLFVSSFVSGCP